MTFSFSRESARNARKYIRVHTIAQTNEICAFHAYFSFLKENGLSKEYFTVFKAYQKQKSLNGFLGLLDLNLEMKFFTISNADSLPNETVNKLRGLCLELFRKIPHKNAEIHGF